MADKTINVKLKQRIDTEANWISKDPILLEGEVAYTKGTSKYKIGDGTNKWSVLPYYEAMTSTDRSKFDGIANGANKTTVDSALSSTSTNPVQNKVVNSALAGKSNTNHTHDLNTMINTLTLGTSDPTDDDYYISQYAGGGTTTTTYHRRPVKALLNYIKSKLSKVATTGSYNDLSDKPTIPSVGNGTITIKQAGASKGTFTMNQSGNTTIELTDNNTTYSTGTPTVSGLTKLYSNTGTNTDGTMTQAALKTALDGKTNTGHTHSSVNDSNDGGSITFAYSKAGMGYSDYTWLAAWNGKELRAVNKNQYATAGHTHNYAGSSSAGGSATSANKLTTARSISLNTGASGAVSFDGSKDVAIPVTSVKESYLSWGGKNYSGSFGCIDAAMIPDLGANRLAFGSGDGITIEYSRDSGSTWTDYGLSTAQRSSILSTGLDAGIGKCDSTNKATATYMLRVTLDTDKIPVYTVLNKFVFYVNTNGSNGCYCTIEASLESTPTTWKTFVNKVSIAGWSGWNVINTSEITTYGNNASSQYGLIRFTFGCTSSSTTHTGLKINKILAFGGQGWTTPSTMARNGHLYGYDIYKNASFPASVSATTFTENGTTLSSKYAALSHTHTKSQITDFPATLKNPNAINIKGAGTTVSSYDGSAVKNLDIVAGTNVTITPDATNGKITIASKDTDTKVIQTAVTESSYTNWRSLVWGASNSGTEGFSPSTVTDGLFSSTSLSVQPSSGTIKAKVFKGSLSGNATSATTATTSSYLKANYIANSTDLNSLTTPGFYYNDANVHVQTFKNCPTTNALFMVVGSHAGVYQEITEYVTSNPKKFMRNYYNGAWGSWYRVYTSANAPTKAEVGLGNVDNTADANKSVKYATSAGSATTATTATTANAVAWGNVTGKPSTYTPSTHSHDNSTITSVDASKIKSGTIDIERLPQGALERCVIVADDTARFKLTTASVQKGDTVKVTGTGKMYFVIDDTKLTSENGYTVYTAGSATSVPWSGVTGKPSTYPPSSHNHDSSYLKLTGGSLSGALNINGDAASQPLKVRGIVGSNGSGTVGDLYLQYGANNKLILGNTGTYSISADGGTYTGTATNATMAVSSKNVIDAGNNSSKTTFAYSKSGMNYEDYSWLAGWNGYELRTVDKSQFATAGHTHTTVRGVYTNNGGQQNPSYIGGGTVRFNMMNTPINGDSNYKDFILMDTYTGSDVPYVTALGLAKTSSPKAFIMAGKKGGTSWDYKAELLTTSNYTSYAPTKTGSGASGSWGISVTGNSATSTKLATARTINGTSFDGSANITTANWGTGRTITIGNTGKTVNGSGNVSWSLSEIGAAASSHDHSVATASVNGFMSASDKNKMNHISYAHYGTTKDATGYYKININSTSSWMLNFTIRVYQNYRAYDIMIGGYNYGSNYWYSPTATILGDSGKSNIVVSFGYDAANKLWVAIPATSYTGLDIFNVTNGFTQLDDFSNLFTITNVSTKPGTVQKDIVAYAPYYRNETVATATALSTSAGSATQPVYFSSGKPVACTYTLGKSVPSNAVFTDTNTWTALKGATTSAAGTAGYAPAPSAGTANRYLRSDGTWSVPPDTNTTYSNMTAATAAAAGKAGLVPAPSAGCQVKFLRGDGTWQVPTNTDTKVTNTLATTTKAYLTGTSSASTNTGTQVFDTGVYLTTTSGGLHSEKLEIGSATLSYDSSNKMITISFN